jgi:hypothetical protein
VRRQGGAARDDRRGKLIRLRPAPTGAGRSRSTLRRGMSRGIDEGRALPPATVGHNLPTPFLAAPHTRVHALALRCSSASCRRRSGRRRERSCCILCEWHSPPYVLQTHVSSEEVNHGANDSHTPAASPMSRRWRSALCRARRREPRVGSVVLTRQRRASLTATSASLAPSSSGLTHQCCAAQATRRRSPYEENK